jgi:TolB protein
MARRIVLVAAVLVGLLKTLEASEPSGQIAFTSRGAIHVMNADGSAQTRLVDGVYPAWSPNGTRIAFWRRAGLSIMDRDGSSVVTLSEAIDWCGGRPAFSPDGQEILFAGRAGGECFLYIMDVIPSSPARQIQLLPSDQNDRAYHGAPAWSPDGSSILFEFSRPSQYESSVPGAPRLPATPDLYRASIDGRDITKLTDDIGMNESAVWSPDGLRIAFYSRRVDGEGIYVMNVDGSNVQLLSPSWAIDWEPSWSPDGEWIAFGSSQSRQSQDIFIMRADGSGVTNLTESRPGEDQHPAWSPVALPPLLTAVPEISWGQVKHQ